MIILEITEAQFHALDDALAYYAMSDYGGRTMELLSDDDKECVQAIKLLREQLDAISTPQPEWCPVCGAYHHDVGEKIDAGRLTRPCPLLPPGVGANHPINMESR